MLNMGKTGKDKRRQLDFDPTSTHNEYAFYPPNSDLVPSNLPTKVYKIVRIQ